ncbi:MAG: ComF family protein [Candidatus Omnitrophota bacterium]|jgi:ComF family protein
MLKTVVNLLYPVLCRVCGGRTDKYNRNVCPACAKSIKERLPPFCARCGRRLEGDPEQVNVCADCKKDEPYFDRAWSAFHYDGPLKGLIHDFKYRKITSLSSDFTTLMAGFMKKYGVGRKCGMILPVPMSPARLFEREINHSGILARKLGKEMRIPYYGNTLRKIKDTLPQSKLKRQERVKNLRSSFSLKSGSSVRGKNILLVDDLFTTGSTVNECSRLLKESGAGYVEVITLARGNDL